MASRPLPTLPYAPVNTYDEDSRLHSTMPKIPHSPSSFTLTHSSKDGQEPSRDTIQARRDAQNKTPTLKILFTALPVFICTTGVAAVLLAYLFIMNSATRDGLAIQSSADLQNLLTISQLSTTVVTNTVPLVVGVLAYLIASDWLRASTEGSSNRPSPSQTSVLMAVLQGGGIGAWIKARLFLFGKLGPAKSQRPTTPSVLTKAVHLAGLLLGLSYAVTGFDTWLHASSRSVYIPKFSAYPANLRTDFGKDLNVTYCTTSDESDTTPFTPTEPATPDNVCGLEQSGPTQYQVSIGEAIRTLSNSSDTNRVVFANDQTAIMAPAFLNSSQPVTYVANSFGVNSVCQSITNQCVFQSGGLWGSSSGPNLNCLNASPKANIVTSPSDNYTVGNIFGVVDPAIGNVGNGNVSLGMGNYQMAKTNPWSVVGVVNSEAYGVEGTNADNGFVPGNSGFFIEGYNGAWNVIYCNVSVRSIQYRYTSPFPSTGDGNYSILSSTPTTPFMTSLFAAYLDSSLIRTYVPQRVDGSGLKNGTMPYLEAFALELSRELMAFTGSVYMPQQAESVQSFEQKLGSRVQVVPLALYVSAVLVYSVVTLIIAIVAITASRSTPFAHLAQPRLTSPIGVIQQLFGPVDPTKSWTTDGLEVFSVESEADRLSVGTTSGSDGAFGVSKDGGVDASRVF